MDLRIPPGGHKLVLNEQAPVRALFIDGSVKKGRLGGGAALDGPTASVGCYWLFDEASRDSTKAELLALNAALSWLNALQAPAPTIVYTDSFQLLEHLDKCSNRYAELVETQKLLAAANVVTLQNIENSKNRRADALARKALTAIR